MSLETVTEFLRIVSGLFAILGVPILFSAVKVLKRMDERQAMHHQTLYGETGTNGLRGDIKVAHKRVCDLADKVQEHIWLLHDLGKRVDDLEKGK